LAPSPHLTAPLRQRPGEMAANAAEVLDYLGVGTVEFLLHPDGEVTFMEVNGRIQVEHPVNQSDQGVAENIGRRSVDPRRGGQPR
jgi:acetyl/propionyl-CoA carboxylase alpha subunit